MATTLFKSGEESNYLNIKVSEEMVDGITGIKVDSVDRSGRWRKTLMHISQGGVRLYNSADDAGICTDGDGRAVIINY